MPSANLVIQKFWEEHPALLYALAILIGCAWTFSGHWALSIPFLFIWLPIIFCNPWLRQRLLLAFCLLLLTVFYCTVHYHFPSLPPEGVLGEGDLEISSLSSSRTHFGSYWVYKGTLRTFTSPETDARHLPVFVTLIDNSDLLRPTADRSYHVQGRLIERKPGSYSFVPTKDAPWLPIQGSWSLAEMRYQAKKAVSRYIVNQMQHARSGTFLAGIATGDFDDPLMAYEFGRFGLQHIMAISGFHFAIIASLLGLFLRLFISKRKVCLLLMFLLCCYFVFLGPGPSILRAWISISIALGGYLLERRAIGLNSLGIAMIAVLIFDPLMWQSIGFQFSFITTAAILLLYSGCDQIMQSLFAKRSLSHTVCMNSINQHGYCALTTIRQALALTLAVNLVALPLMLFYFHKFPWMSLAYNLFFPFLVSISMLLLMLGTFVQAILPFLGELIHSLNSHFTHFMLNYTYQMPVTVDFVWRVESISIAWLLLYLCIVFSAGLWLRYSKTNTQEFELV